MRNYDRTAMNLQHALKYARTADDCDRVMNEAAQLQDEIMRDKGDDAPNYSAFQRAGHIRKQAMDKFYQVTRRRDHD